MLEDTDGGHLEDIDVIPNEEMLLVRKEETKSNFHDFFSPCFVLFFLSFFFPIHRYYFYQIHLIFSPFF